MLSINASPATSLLSLGNVLNFPSAAFRQIHNVGHGALRHRESILPVRPFSLQKASLASQKITGWGKNVKFSSFPQAAFQTGVGGLELSVSIPEVPSSVDNSPTGCAGDAAVLLDVGDMMCGGCAASVRNILSSQPGVKSASVNLVTHTAAVQLDLSQLGGQGSPAEVRNWGGALAALLTERGFTSSARCPGEADSAALKRRLELVQKRQDAVQRSRIQVAVAGTLAALCCGGHLGHVFHLFGMHHLAHGPIFSALDNPQLKCAISLAALLGPARDLVADGARSLVRGAPNMNSLVGLGSSAAFAVSSVALLQPNLGLDMSFFEEPTMLLAVVLLGRALEAQARAQASSDLQALLSLVPATCRLLVGEVSEEDESGREGLGLSIASAVEVGSAQLRPGDCILVLPGETIPVDGVVTAGRSAVDESMFTGEALPLAKSKGALVSAGTVNWEGPIAVTASATGANCTVAAITRMVEAAQGREAPVQRLADRIAGPFVFSIVGLSAATFAFWYLVGVHLFPDVLLSEMAGDDGSALLLSIKLAIDVMVVACPCALGLATPTAVLVGTSLGAGRGLLLRGGDVLERLANVTTIVFDKTGTLTEGRPSVAAVATVAEGGQLVTTFQQEREVLALAAAVEGTSKHPLADAIIARASGLGLSLPSVRHARTLPGEGALATVQRKGAPDGIGHLAVVGTLDLVLRTCCNGTGQDVNWAKEEEGWRRVGERLHHELLREVEDAPGRGGRGPGRTLAYVGMEGRGLLGAICVADRTREDADSTVARLAEMGIDSLIMSGDELRAAQAVGQEVGIATQNVFGRLLPQDKAQKVGEIRHQGGCVAMVGDGVNDAPALAAADVGIAISRGGGADAASDAASVILLGNRLSQLAEAVELSRATMGKVKQNLFWALAYNTVALPLAAGALLPAFDIALTPSLAGGMMAFSSIAVVSNSLLLRLHQPRKL